MAPKPRAPALPCVPEDGPLELRASESLHGPAARTRRSRRGSPKTAEELRRLLDVKDRRIADLLQENAQLHRQLAELTAELAQRVRPADSGSGSRQEPSHDVKCPSCRGCLRVAKLLEPSGTVPVAGVMSCPHCQDPLQLLGGT